MNAPGESRKVDRGKARALIPLTTGHALSGLVLVSGFWLSAAGMCSPASAAVNDAEAAPSRTQRLVLEGRVESRTGGVRRLAFGHSGRVSQIVTAVGDRVRRGQRLAQLECSGVKADLAAAEAELELQRLSFARRKQGPSAHELDVVRERLALSQADLAAAEANRDRLDSLARKNGVVSKQELEAAARRTIAARLDLATSQHAYDRALKPGSPEQELEDSARERVRIANVSRARHQLSLCEIVSPVDAVVAAIHMRSGEVAGATDVVVSVVDDTDRFVSVWIPQNATARVNSGQKLRIRIPAVKDGSFDGVVTWVSPVMSGDYAMTPDPCTVACGMRAWIEAPVQIADVPLFSMAYVELPP